MFASLKNKIKEETGSDVPSIQSRPLSTRYQRSRLGSIASTTSIEDLTVIEQKDAEIQALRIQCNELTIKCNDLNGKLDDFGNDKKRLEQANHLLDESVKVAQVQKDMICDEQDKIQNLQLQEISNLKNLLLFREQESIDRISVLKQSQQQAASLKTELMRIKDLEPMFEDAKDELERLRHSSQLEKNSLTITLAAVEEENRHLKSRLEIVEESRINFTTNFSKDEKMKILLQERKLLESRLEEAHLHLSDIKSTWSGQNLALETQVSRLSRQVAEETTEKRKYLKIRDDYAEKFKQLEFDLEKFKEEINQRDSKIKILEEEIEDLGATLKETRTENEEEITFLRTKNDQTNQESNELRNRLLASDLRLTEYIESSEKITNSLRGQIRDLQEQVLQLSKLLEEEKQEKISALLKNAAISQSEDIFKQELRQERDEIVELTEKLTILQDQIKREKIVTKDLRIEINGLNELVISNNEKLVHIDIVQIDLAEKNKSIKILNQRLADMKKTLQQEIKSNNLTSNNNHENYTNQLNSNSNANNFSKIGTPIIMDEVNFKYLKHVVVKFLTSREVEARQLIKVVVTVLQLNSEEEKILHDTLNWKMSWFGSRPDPGNGQMAFSIPPI